MEIKNKVERKKIMLQVYQSDLSRLDQDLYDFVDEVKEVYDHNLDISNLVYQLFHMDQPYDEIFQTLIKEIKSYRNEKQLLIDDQILLFRLSGLLQYEHGMDELYELLKQNISDSPIRFMELYGLVQENEYRKGIEELNQLLEKII